MAEMTERTKSILRATAAKKRGRLLKDVPPDTLFIMADRYIDECRDGHNPHGDGWCYLKWATPAQLDAMERGCEVVCDMFPGTGVPHGRAKIPCVSGVWEKRIFPMRVVMHILRHVVTNPDKYVTAQPTTCPRCRGDHLAGGCVCHVGPARERPRRQRRTQADYAGSFAAPTLFG